MKVSNVRICKFPSYTQTNRYDEANMSDFAAKPTDKAKEIISTSPNFLSLQTCSCFNLETGNVSDTSINTAQSLGDTNCSVIGKSRFAV